MSDIADALEWYGHLERKGIPTIDEATRELCSRVVAGYARDREDFRDLLCVLGLEQQ